MGKEEIKSKVLVWAIGLVEQSELDAITDRQWDVFCDLATLYLDGCCCDVGWNNLIHIRMQEAGCSYLIADMFSWARYELSEPGSTDRLLVRKSAGALAAF